MTFLEAIQRARPGDVIKNGGCGTSGNCIRIGAGNHVCFDMQPTINDILCGTGWHIIRQTITKEVLR